MYEHFYAVIMAGGGGTRLWPLSRLNRPKQLLQLGSEQSLFELAIKRLDGIFTPEQILVVTTEGQAKSLRLQAPQIPSQNFLIEPQPRGTASVVGLAAMVILKRDPDASMAILTADHLINNIARFHELIQAAFELSRENWLVTLGIKPDFPSTGYGYILKGSEINFFNHLSAFEVKEFKEKPDLANATRYVADGNHFWNSGMFFWQASTILNEFKRQMPDLYSTLMEINTFWDDEIRKDEFTQKWDSIKPQTIDYGIMEGANRVAVLPVSDLGWSDVGSWDSLFAILEKDENGNINLGGITTNLDGKDTLVFSDDQQKIIVTIGTQDLVIVDTRDALLVCPRDQAQRIKEIINLLKEKGHHRYL